jgi:hypothetical protein
MDRHLLRLSISFVWLFTGLAVLHPYYRQVGHDYLAPLGLPDWLMYVACALEVVLGLRVLLGPPRPWLTGLQLLLIACFTVILAVEKPALLADPFGVLSKNVTLAALIVTAQLVEREGWTPRARWVLRGGLAFVWVWEGLLACVFFQSQALRDVLAGTGLPLGDPELLLKAAGVGQALGGLAILCLRGRLLRLLLALQLAGLIVICVLVTWYDAQLWWHPFGPITKNVPLILGTALVIYSEGRRR